MRASQLLPFVLLACSGDKSPTESAPDTAGPSLDSADSAVPESDPVDVFSFGIIADPHVTGPGEHLDRLDAAVAHLNAVHAETPLAFVTVLGDIAWGGGWDVSHTALSQLTMPWVPIQGDNPIQVGEETGFSTTFGSQFAALSTQLDGWQMGPIPTDDPVYGQVWLTNLAFTVEGVTVVGLDWNSREVGSILGETPDLFDLPGGTLPFFEGVLDGLDEEGLDGQVLMLSHMPMLYGPGFFDLDEVAVLEERVGTRSALLGINHAGHLHAHAEGDWPELGFDVTITDATWDDDNSVRLVSVARTDRRFVWSSTAQDVTAD